MEYKVGDKVRIRSWNSMANEFGVDDEGDIYIPDEIFFVRDMRSYCGTIHQITRKFQSWDCDGYSLEDLSCSYSRSMFDQSFKE